MKCCIFCGGRVIFRCCRRMPDGRVVWRRKPFPIHLDGPCGRCK